MNFSFLKATSLRPQKEKRLSTFLIAVLTASAFFVPYIIAGQGYFIFFGDFNVQQIPFYKLCHKAVRSGNIGWSFTTDLGANFIGSYSFYLLGSPFFWLTIPFPNSFIPYLMGPLLILKFGCAAFTAYVYIRRFTKTPAAAQAGALLYAFSGFSIYNIFFNHFHEAIIFFPLLLYALELLMTENKRGVFCLAVAACCVVNYFFFFGMVIFTVLYFFVRLFSGAVKVKFGRFLIIALEAVLGVGIACVLLIPSLCAIIGNGRISEILTGWGALVYGKAQIYPNIIQCFFFPPDIPAVPVFFPGAKIEWSSLAGWLPLFSTVGVFTYYFSRKKSWLKKLFAISVFMMLVPILNSAFYAFNECYYARWFYMPILMMCLMTASMTEDPSADWGRGFKWTLGITAAFAAAIGFFPQEDENGKLIFGLYTRDGDDLYYTVRYWIICATAIASLGILYILLKAVKENRRVFYRGAVACICIISIIYGNVFIATGRSYSYDIKGTMIDNLIEGEVKLEGDGFFRIDTYDGVDNTGMFLGYSTINAFQSVVPASITDFYEYIGQTRDVASRPDENVPAIRSLLSVKYMLSRTDGNSFVDKHGDAVISGFEYLKTEGGYYVYENKSYIPMGFCYDYYMTEDYLEPYSGDSRTRMMLKAVLLTKEQIVKYRDCLDDVSELSYDYGYLDESDNFVVSSDIKLNLDDQTMAQDAERLKNNSCYSFETDNNGFTAKINRESRSLVFFSIPYDEGWSAEVNGVDVEIERVNKGFMAVAVPSGDTTIRFTYKTPGLSLGLKTAAVSFGAFLIYFLVSVIYIKKHPSETCYPEGEELISRWHKDEIAEAASEIYGDNGDDDGDYAPKSILFSDDADKPSGESKYSGGFSIDSDIYNDK